MRCHSCGVEYVELFIPCQSPSCSNHCAKGSYCPTCQNQIPQLIAEAEQVQQKSTEACIEHYFQLKSIAQTLGIPFQDRQNYQLSNPQWSNFFPAEVSKKWAQLKTTQFSPETQQSELLTENKQLTTALNLKNRELKDLQAEVRALHSQLNEKENNSGWQSRINQLETKLNLVKDKLIKWSQLLVKK